MRYELESVAVVLKQSMGLIQGMREASHWVLKPDGSLLTEVDSANEEFLRRELTRDGEFFIGEESIARNGDEYVQRAFQGRTWVVDPIDGTAPFAHHLPLWGISLGYMEEGVLTGGAIALPDLGQCFLSDGKSVKMATNIHRPVDEWNWLTLEPPEDIWNPGRMITLGQRFTRKNTLDLPNPLLTPGSAVHSLSCLLTGNAIAYIGHVKLWDIAGVLPLLIRLGYSLEMLNGKTMTEKVVQDGLFELDTQSPTCWALRDTFICAPAKVLKIVREKLC